MKELNVIEKRTTFFITFFEIQIILVLYNNNFPNLRCKEKVKAKLHFWPPNLHKLAILDP
jgi:hypothetical protein